MLDIYACVFYDNFVQQWRYHVWFNFFSIVSPADASFTTPHEAIKSLEECVANIVVQPVHIHYVIYGFYGDYFLDVFQMTLDEEGI